MGGFFRVFLSSIKRRVTNQTTRMDPSERYCYNPTLRWNPRVEEYFIKAYGAEHFSRISTALTRPSCYSCIRVNMLKSTSDAVIEKLLAALKEAGLQNTCHNIRINKIDVNVMSVVGQKPKNTVEESNCLRNLDDWSEAHLDISENADPLKESSESGFISKCQFHGLDYVLFVKGSGPHAIEYEYREDRPPKEVIVSRKCAEAVLRGAQVYVPGVLACSAHVEKGDVVAVSVAVEQPIPNSGWGIGITRGTVLQGLQTDAHYYERNGLYIGQGTAMMSRSGIFRVSEGIAVDMNNRVFKLPSLNDLLEGEIFLQNLPSIITAHALDPQEGERVLDMCAAPGGKTTAIAILMKDKGEVVAVDRSHNKVLDIQKLAAEMGLNCITTYKLDVLKAVCQSSDSHEITTLRGSEDLVTIQNSDSLTSKMENISSIATEGFDIGSIHQETRHETTEIEVLDLTKRYAVKEGFSKEQAKNGIYTSKAELRKTFRRLKNGPGRNHCLGGRVEKSEGFSPSSFDRVLLDAPCSALGLRPRLFSGEVTIESLRSHARYQRRMFDVAVQLVRPGGIIVYSTCTINPGENEAMVRYALDKYKFLSLASQHPRSGGPGLVGGCEFPDGHIEDWLRPGEEDLVQRFDPSSPLDTIGFFIAKFNVGPKET